MGARFLPAAALFAFALPAMTADFDAGLKAYQAHDYATALKEWQPLAKQGNRSVQFNLGLMYMDGQGVPQDFAEAAEWFRKSARQGFVKAQYNLGELLATGKGIKKDYVEAHMWLNLCAATGNTTCAEHRDLLAKKMKKPAIAEAQRRASLWQRQEDAAKEYNPDAPLK
jgi:TPR repeat protein